MDEKPGMFQTKREAVRWFATIGCFGIAGGLAAIGLAILLWRHG